MFLAKFKKISKRGQPSFSFNVLEKMRAALFSPFKKIKGKKGQHSLEYMTLIALVMAGVIVMGNYVIRSWNANVKGWDDSVADSYQDPFVPGVSDPRSCTPVDGGWTDWSECDGIAPNCTQSRSCTDPPPACGGKDCEGETVQNCTECEACTPVDGGWTDWSECDGEPPDCTRTRACLNPEPFCGGNDCSGPATESCECEEEECEITCAQALANTCCGAGAFACQEFCGRGTKSAGCCNIPGTICCVGQGGSGLKCDIPERCGSCVEVNCFEGGPPCCTGACNLRTGVCSSV